MVDEINTNLDTTPLPPNNLVAQDPQSAELAGYVRTKTFGRDVRESIARSIELNSTRSKNAEELANETLAVTNRIKEDTATAIINMANQVELIRDDKDAVIANATVDSEVILARGGKVTLGERLNEMELNATGIDFANFGAVGDGITDDTIALQKAFDYSAKHGIPVFNSDRNKTFIITSPLYVDRYARIDFGGGKLKKTTNTVGTGSNTTHSGTIIDSYAKDAFIIVRHLDEWIATDVSIKNVMFKKGAPTIVEYGIYAPRMQMCEIEGIWADYYATNYCLYGYMHTMMSKVHNIKQYNGKTTYMIVDDGSHYGGSTSILASHIVGYDQDGCIDWYGAPYSVINNCMIDKSHKIAFKFQSCPGIVINSPSIEQNDGTLFHLSDSKIVVNSARVLYNQGVAGLRYLNYVGQKSYLTFNNCEIHDYQGTFNSAEQMDMTIADDSHVILINSIMPKNGNNYGSYTNGSTLTKIDRDGTSYTDSNGSGSKSKGLRYLLGTSAPTTGTWKTGEEIINTSKLNGIDKWVCTLGGSPGTWIEVRTDGFKRIAKQAIWAGDGATKSFSLQHGLGKKPTSFSVTPANVHAQTAKIGYATVTDTTLTVVFDNAISSGNSAYVQWEVSE